MVRCYIVRVAAWFAALAEVGLIFALFAHVSLAAAELDHPAPPLVARELNGDTFDLSAEHGKVVLVSFWATWCAPCRQEMPALNDFYRRYHAQGLEIIGLSVDRPRAESDVRKVMKSFAYPAAMADNAQENGFGMPGTIPTTFVIGRDGVVRAQFTPDQTLVTTASLSKVVLPLLNAKGG
jgi:cytochrome c biogenesis protein CcmG, thiol:disulfide interchange protein DsbE